MKYNYFPLWLEIWNLLEEVADSTEQSNKEMCAMFVKATSQNTLRFFLSHLCILCQQAPLVGCFWESRPLLLQNNTLLRRTISTRSCWRQWDIQLSVKKQKALQRKLKIHPVGCLKSFRKKKKSIVRVIKINSSTVKSVLPDLKGLGTHWDR